MAKYYVQTFDRVFRQWVVEADCKSDARELAKSGEGEEIDWGICKYNVAAPSKAILIEYDEDP